ncbi:flavodoxin domain-containing protein [Arthrobacter sp. Soil761]|uniref:flavodoxin domain-containing protein n=1 Tax=Arthrobacter sp. Soil761 TaxID=1736400 RepID=UPI0006FB6D00|nr:flavodoxin domain-containing protein [Arthrobacter sp. Soil761]KRE67210.1 protoporphyrinogen oxidase [Arthrobacter sp. Soil761]
MARILIPYGTSEGQTARIADYISDVLQAHGHQADTLDLKHADHGLPDGYDGVIVGASIHAGKHEGYVADFVRRNRSGLERLPAALFSVSLSAHAEPEEAEKYVAEFEDSTGWHPDKVAMFGGALLYTQYGFLKRMMMKKIVSGQGSPDTDTGRDYIYTEWDGVRRFAEELLVYLEREPGPES